MGSVISVRTVMIHPGTQENFLCWYSWEPEGAEESVMGDFQP